MKAYHVAISPSKRIEKQLIKNLEQQKKLQMLRIRSAEDALKWMDQNIKDKLILEKIDLLKEVVDHQKIILFQEYSNKKQRLSQYGSPTQSLNQEDKDFYQQAASLSLKQWSQIEPKINVRTFHEYVLKTCNNFNALIQPINKLKEQTIDYFSKRLELQDPEQLFLNFNKNQFDVMNRMLNSAQVFIRTGQEALHRDVQNKKKASKIKRVSSKLSNQSNQSEIKSLQGSVPPLNDSGIQKHINQNGPSSAQVQVVESEDRSTDQFKPSFDQ